MSGNYSLGFERLTFQKRIVTIYLCFPLIKDLKKLRNSNF